MNVVIINSSPKEESSNTHFLLTSLIKGLKKEKANIDYYFLSRLNIESCLGCNNICGNKKDLDCIIDDDMKLIIPKLNNADIWILGTPIYLDGIYSTLKTFIQRMCIFSKSDVILVNDRYRHPLKDNIKRGTLFLAAVSGFCELTNFNLAISEIKSFCDHIPKNDFICSITRPDTRFFNKNIRNRKVEEIQKALEIAGSQIIKNGSIEEIILNKISQKLS